MARSNQDASAVERHKRERNIRTLQIAQSLASDGFNAKSSMRIVCECADYLCNELIRIPYRSYSQSVKNKDSYYIIKGHVFLKGGEVMKTEKQYQIIHNNSQ